MSPRLLHTGVALAAIAFGTSAQSYPDKPIRLVIPFAPGGTSEIIARSVANELTGQLGQTVLVESKAGGAGTLAMSDVAKARPDGYTIIVGHVGSLAVNPFAMARQPYDVNKDFLPVAFLATVPNLFVVHVDVPAKDFKEFLALAKSKPGEIHYGSAGNGSAGHLAFEYLKMVTGTNITHVPYRGTGPQLQDLIAGRVQATSAGTPALLPHIKSGKLRALAVGTRERIPALPDIPTVAELGYKDFETSQWYGVLAPAGTPRPIVQKLNAEINKALRSASVTQRFAHDNASVTIGSPEEFGAFIKAEQKRWEKVVKASQLRIE